MSSVLTVHHLTYIHVLDNNTNITRLEVGPQLFTPKQHERVLGAPTPFVIIPPQHFAVVTNPVVPATRDNPPYKLKWRDSEIRLSQPPFPLYPGEQISSLQQLQTVERACAFRLEALRNFTDDDGQVRQAGDQWLFHGPATYYPRTEVKLAETIKGTEFRPNSALKIRAIRATVDRDGNRRLPGEEWAIHGQGVYVPSVDEVVVGPLTGIILTREQAVHLSAIRTFVDCFGQVRKAGSEWLVTLNETEVYIPGVHEELVGIVPLTTLAKNQYCIVVNPFNAKQGINELGRRELRKGPAVFFLHPRESLEGGTKLNAVILRADEALLVQAIENFPDEDAINRKSGDRWMIAGPRSYIPPAEVRILETRVARPLSSSEGIYVRNLATGAVRAVIGERSYMLSAEEELWQKELPDNVEMLLAAGGGTADRDDVRKTQFFTDYAVPNVASPATSTSRAPSRSIASTSSSSSSSSSSSTSSTNRDKSRVVTFRAPGNTAVQIYDSKAKTSRVEFGPALILLQPYEEFTVLKLSAGKPKREGALQCLCLLLGHDFVTEDYEVETSDHARLRVRLSANVHFEVDRSTPQSISKLFNIPDYIGAICRTIGSRIRGRIAATPFDEFHRSSASIINSAVFGNKSALVFASNGLVVSNIDVQAVECVDEKTRASLQKSVQLAIEITTKSQEADARQEAEKREQTARGLLILQTIQDEARQEESREKLVKYRSENKAIEISAEATAEARARADALKLTGKSEIEMARLRADAQAADAEARYSEEERSNEIELKHKSDLYDLEIEHARVLAEIEAAKFARIINAIGKDTIKAMAQAGPETQAKLLGGLGLQSVLISDGRSPLNLFDTARGMLTKK